MAALRPVFVALTGAALAGAWAYSAPLVFPIPEAALPVVALAPDIASASAGAAASCAATALAGSLIALSTSQMARRGGAGAAPVQTAGLALINPVALWSYAGGAQASLTLAAMLLVAGAGMVFAVHRDYRATPLLALALAAAPFLSGAILWLYPLLFFLLPLLSPWGYAPRRAVGFTIVAWAPFAMVLLSLWYFGVLSVPFADARLIAPPGWRAAFGGDFLTLAAGAFILACAAVSGRRIAGAGAFLAGAALMAVRAGWIA